MSFIIARKENKNLVIISDTKITTEKDYCKNDRELAKNIKLYGALKSYIITDCICIAFAGDVEEANLLMEDIRQHLISNNNEISLEDIHHLTTIAFLRDFKNTDYIIGYMNEDIPNIYIFKDNKIGKNVEFGWIGDIDVFNKYQEFLHTGKDGYSHGGISFQKEGFYIEAGISIQTASNSNGNELWHMKYQLAFEKAVESGHSDTVYPPVIITEYLKSKGFVHIPRLKSDVTQILPYSRNGQPVATGIDFPSNATGGLLYNMCSNGNTININVLPLDKLVCYHRQKDGFVQNISYPRTIINDYQNYMKAQKK